MKVKDLPEAERPRERLLQLGAQNLTERELLAILLGSGVPGQDVIELAAVLIDGSGGLPLLAERADPHVMMGLAGIGAAKAARVAAAFELARRAGLAAEKRRIASSTDVAEVAAPYLRGLRHERVVVVVADAGGRLLRVAPMTEGAVDHCLLPVRDVLQAVLSIGGSRFGVAHNHPSGTLKPSDADVGVTARLREAAETVGLRFLDHLILTEDKWARIPRMNAPAREDPE
jgi:DNA repair protein RadC